MSTRQSSTTPRPAAGATLAVPASPLAWMDAATQATDTWLQWQASLWQPCIELQVAWFNYLAQTAGWPALQTRGAEQLG